MPNTLIYPRARRIDVDADRIRETAFDETGHLRLTPELLVLPARYFRRSFENGEDSREDGNQNMDRDSGTGHFGFESLR